MRIQLWSYNYEPEPSGIAPLSAVWARAMRDRGHDVRVVAAHPHYPKPVWGRRLRPYRERRDGVEVLRLPLWIGRRTGAERVRQELSYMASLSVVAPLLGPADVIVAVSPSFPGLLPAMVASTVRHTPWVLWLQDILPEGAAATGLIEADLLLRAARRFELSAYASASRVVVISEAFRRNLTAKGVPEGKLVRIFNPSPVPVAAAADPAPDDRPRHLLVMGNIGRSQGLATVVESLQRTRVLDEVDAELRIAGHGVAADEVQATIASPRVRMLGLLFGLELESELASAMVGLVTQRSGIVEFNLPSKLMNYFAHGLPVLAVVDPGSETARLVREAEAGWVVDTRDPEALAAAIREVVSDQRLRRERAAAALRIARERFAPERVADRFESVLRDAVSDRVA